MPGIAFQGITKRFGSSTQPAVDDVTLAVPEGGTCMLVGRSGAGKTTLLRMVNRLIEPTSGAILVSGKNILDYYYALPTQDSIRGYRDLRRVMCLVNQSCLILR